MKRTSYAIEMNSNSWHVYKVVEHFHYHGDDCQTDYFEIAHEFDLAPGHLENFILSMAGFEKLMHLDDMNMFLSMFPAPKI